MRFFRFLFVALALLNATESFAGGKGALHKKILRTSLTPISCGEITDQSLPAAQDSYNLSIGKILEKIDIRGEAQDDVARLTANELISVLKVALPLILDPELAVPARLLGAQLFTRQKIRRILNWAVTEQQFISTYFLPLSRKDPVQQQVRILLTETVEKLNTVEINLDRASQSKFQTTQNLEPIFNGSLVHQTLRDLEDLLRTAEDIQLRLETWNFLRTNPLLTNLEDTNLRTFRSMPRPDFTQLVNHVILVSSWQGVGEHVSRVIGEFKETMRATQVLPTLISPQSSLVKSRQHQNALIVHASEIAKATAPLLKDYAAFIDAIGTTRAYPEGELLKDATEALELIQHNEKKLYSELYDAAVSRDALERAHPFQSTHVPGLNLWERDMLASFESLQRFIQAMAKLHASSQTQVTLYRDFTKKARNDWNYYKRKAQ